MLAAAVRNNRIDEELGHRCGHEEVVSSDYAAWVGNQFHEANYANSYLSEVARGVMSTTLTSKRFTSICLFLRNMSLDISSRTKLRGGELVEYWKKSKRWHKGIVDF